MVDTPQITFPWERLPDELKLEILKYRLLSNEGPTNFGSRQEILPLLLTSKRMWKVAMGVWGCNDFYLCIDQDRPVPPRYRSSMAPCYRKLDLQTEVCDDLTWTQQHLDNYRGGWHFLLSPDRESCIDTLWQTNMTELDKLVVTLRVEPKVWYTVARSPDYGFGAICLSGQDIETFLKEGRSELRAKSVTVQVKNLWCGEYSTADTGGAYNMMLGRCRHRCAQRLAEGLKAKYQREDQEA